MGRRLPFGCPSAPRTSAGGAANPAARTPSKGGDPYSWKCSGTGPVPYGWGGGPPTGGAAVVREGRRQPVKPRQAPEKMHIATSRSSNSPALASSTDGPRWRRPKWPASRSVPKGGENPRRWKRSGTGLNSCVCAQGAATLGGHGQGKGVGARDADPTSEVTPRDTRRGMRRRSSRRQQARVCSHSNTLRSVRAKHGAQAPLVQLKPDRFICEGCGWTQSRSSEVTIPRISSPSSTRTAGSSRNNRRVAATGIDGGTDGKAGPMTWPS